MQQRISMKVLILAAIVLSVPIALAKDMAPTILPPYAAICIDESAERYYLGEEGRWRSERTEAKGRVELEKLDYEAVAKHADPRDIAACTAERITTIASHIHFVEGCYEVKEFDEQGRVADRREMCSEYYYDGRVMSVDCRVLSFQPDGTFRRQRWVPDSRDKGQDAVLKTAGTCRVLQR